MTREMKLALAAKASRGAEQEIVGIIIEAVAGGSITLESILKKSSRSEGVTANVLGKLCKKSVLIRVRQGVYAVNPYLPELVELETKSWLGG